MVQWHCPGATQFILCREQHVASLAVCVFVGFDTLQRHVTAHLHTMLSPCALGNVALLAAFWVLCVLVAQPLRRTAQGPHASVLYAVSCLGCAAFVPPDVGHAAHAALMLFVALGSIGLVAHPAAHFDAPDLAVRYPHLLFAPIVGIGVVVHAVHCCVGVSIWALATALARLPRESWTVVCSAAVARSVLYTVGGALMHDAYTLGDGLWAFVHADGARRAPSHPKWGPATNTSTFSMLTNLAGGMLGKAGGGKSTATPAPAARPVRKVQPPRATRHSDDVLDAPSSDDDE